MHRRAWGVLRAWTLVAAVCPEMGACSSTGAPGADGGLSLPVDNSRLVGCTTTAAGCYTNGVLNDTHVAPNIDQRPPVGDQHVVEEPPGTYTIGPVVFDEAGDWTVRFHFNELCCDVVPDSPHGHAAFHIHVP
jgi:hypothetical protein